MRYSGREWDITRGTVKILLQTRFFPSVGGIETLALILCREWQSLGHKVTVSTDVQSPEKTEQFPYPVHYQADHKLLIDLWRSNDVVVMMNVSLKTVWPILLIRTPLIFIHQSNYWLDRKERRDWRERLKLSIAEKNSYNVCASLFIREATDLRAARIIPNCYDDSVFKEVKSAKRPRSVAFVGRLVSDKGANLLLEAAASYPGEMDLEITIIGDGPERAALEDHAGSFARHRFRFTGSLSAELVAAELREHEILVVPSIWKEPFGIVALEGMACGCVPLVSDGGGLPEAVGNAGQVFQSGNARDLAEQIQNLLGDDLLRTSLRAAAPSHLSRHTARKMAEDYLELARRAVDES